MRLSTKLLYLLPLTLTGCALFNEEPRKVKWETRVEVKSEPADITFSSGRTVLSSAAKETLKSLLCDFSHPSEAYVRIYGENVIGVKPSVMNVTRGKVIARFLKTQGVPCNNIEIFDKSELAGTGETQSSNVFKVIVDHYQVIPPKCPGWNQEMHILVPPEGEVNFGCTNEANFAAMIADPRVLVEGKDLAGMDANRTGKAINDYRLDNIKKLKIEKVDSVSTVEK